MKIRIKKSLKNGQSALQKFQDMQIFLEVLFQGERLHLTMLHRITMRFFDTVLHVKLKIFIEDIRSELVEVQLKYKYVGGSETSLPNSRLGTFTKSSIISHKVSWSISLDWRDGIKIFKNKRLFLIEITFSSCLFVREL